MFVSHSKVLRYRSKKIKIQAYFFSYEIKDFNEVNNVLILHGGKTVI